MRLCGTVPVRYTPKPSASHLVQIQNGTFYRQHPSVLGGSNPPLFPNLHFALPATPRARDTSDGVGQQHWAVIGAGGATVFLEILRGLHVCIPPNARTFPYLASKEIEAKDYRLRTPARAIQYVGFTSNKNNSINREFQGSYLSARYESRREQTDWSLLQHLQGETALNPAQDLQPKDPAFGSLLSQVIKDLQLEHLIAMPVSNLSNGQRRRASIAKALLGRPELLLLDEPFMGLDPPTLVSLSPMLRELAYKSSPRLLMSLRPQDPIPDWITHLAILGSSHKLALAGPKSDVLFATHRWAGADHFRKGGIVAEMAQGMTREYGEPPIGIGQVLASKGIDEWRTHSTVVSGRSPRYIQPSGEMIPEHLDQADEQLWRDASQNLRDNASLDQLLALTCLLPRKFKVIGNEISLVDQSALDGYSEEGKDQLAPLNEPHSSVADPIVELNSVVVSYGSKTVLGQGIQHGRSTPGLNLTIRRGTRLALIGPNGSGKTTLLSLITSDHPQSYALPIKFFGQSRLPSPGQPGLSFWDVQSRIGHSSPEIHAFFPKQLTIRRTLESAWADTFAAKPKFSIEDTRLVDAFLRWWEPELNPSYHASVAYESCKNTIDAWISESYPHLNSSLHPTGGTDWASSATLTFGALPFQSQRLLLFLRAIIKGADMVILDEAFSGLNTTVRDKALMFLEAGQRLVPHRQPTTDDHSVENDQRERSGQGTTNRGLEVDKLCCKAGIAIADLYHGSRPLAPEIKERRDRLRNMSTDQLSAMAADDGVSPSKYEFTGLASEQALIVVSHVREEIPTIVNEYLRLPGEEEAREQKRGAETGSCEGSSIRTIDGWNRMWGLGR